MFLDDSACNLASINLMKFVARSDAGEFDVVAFEAACRTMITAQEILVDNSSYPTRRSRRTATSIVRSAWATNLGALLMSRGLPADSDGRPRLRRRHHRAHARRRLRAVVKIARDHGGPFAGYEKNREPFLRVMRKHRAALKDIDKTNVRRTSCEAAKAVWDEVIEMGEQHGFRNAQATVLAPTGTIGFMMDCDTTGVEPDIALVKYKKLVGGGLMKIVNQTVPMALEKLGYSAQQVKEIVEYIDENETIEGRRTSRTAPAGVRLRVQAGARRALDPHMGHIKMMGATQPFLSGAISKTVNVPKEATIEEISRPTSTRGWARGRVDLSRWQQAHAAAQHVEGQRVVRP